jgi:hypothetical protein
MSMLSIRKRGLAPGGRNISPTPGANYMTETSLSRLSLRMHGGEEFEHLWFVTAEVLLYAVPAGSRNGPLQIPWHGFPEF